VYDFGEYEGTPYMIVEFVPGGSLAGKMQQTPLDQVTALGYLRGIAEGLDYAHSLGIVHRDVKPANVLLEKNGTPVIADFGLVKLLQGSSVQSLTGVTTGTPAYMAPEQVMGHQVGAAADRYSLATMAYEMLTGSIPFEGEGVLELLYAHVHRDPPPPSSRNTALTPAVDAVILRGLAKDANARWESCTAFVDALAAALVGATPAAGGRTVVLPPAAIATKPLPRAAEPAAATVERAPADATIAMAMPPPGVSPAPPARTGRPRRRLVEVAVGVVLLLLLLLAGGICAATQQPTLSIDRNIVAPGDTVTATITHLPANQSAEIRLASKVVYPFPFKATGGGNASVLVNVPPGIELGTHHVQLCWDGSCPKAVLLTVVAPGTAPSPTPSAGPTATPSGTPGGKPSGKPTPRPSPTPGASPAASPTSVSTPKASPKPTPSPSPRPTPTPTSSCPTPTAGPKLTPSPATVIGGGAVLLAGANFTPNRQVTLKYYKGNASTPSQTWTATVLCNGTFNTSFTTATGIARTDTVTAADTAGRFQTANITVLLHL
jgi:serine/threonine-protein kinase